MQKLYETIRAELLPCANCGGPATLTRGITGMYGVVCPCGSHVFYGAEWSAEKTTAAWNTRAERTCHIVRVDADPDRVLESIMPKGYSVFFERCSECGETIPSIKESTERANYCPNCGARVVEVSGHAGE